MNLYEIAIEYRDTANKLADLDLDEQTIADTLDSISGDLNAKSINLSAVIKNLESLAGEIGNALGDMGKRKTYIEKRAARLREYLLNCMQISDVEKIECAHYRISRRDNPESVVIYDENVIPALYLTDPAPPAPKPDKNLIKQAIKDGAEVPGAWLTRTQRVDIK